MGLKNGSPPLEEEKQEKSEANSFFSDYRQLSHYLSLLCFLLTMVTLLLTLCLVQITLMFKSTSTPQKTKVRDLTDRLEQLNQSYQLLFTQYPALNQYCTVSNTTTGERECSPCPLGWLPQGQKCFLFSGDRSDWLSGQYRCLALGGATATVRTEEEQEFVWRTAQRLSQGDSYWLGLRRAGGEGGEGGEGGWRWGDGTPLDTGPEFWERVPDSTETREQCGRLTPVDNYRTSWFVSRCSNQLRRICERRQAAMQ